MIERFESSGIDGYLHKPEQPNGYGLALTHSAGANCQSPLLTAVASALTEAGWTVLRFNLAFRQAKRFGPPHPAMAARDREAVRKATNALRSLTPAGIVAGGHSYGGRQVSMLVAEDPAVAAALLLLSYPLHPPKQPEKPRTAHWSKLKTPTLFVHGATDPFASIAELKQAFELLPAEPGLAIVDGAGHELKQGKFDLRTNVVFPLHAILKV